MLSSVDQTMWLTMLSTAVLVVVIGSAVAMLVAAENRKIDELNHERQNKCHRQVPSQQTVPSEESR